MRADKQETQHSCLLFTQVMGFRSSVWVFFVRWFWLKYQYVPQTVLSFILSHSCVREGDAE